MSTLEEQPPVEPTAGATVESEESDDASEAPRSTWGAVSVGCASVAGLALAGMIGYSLGDDSGTTTQAVKRCVSTPAQIGCVLDDGSYVDVPLRTMWIDGVGGMHDGSRPSCLPPGGYRKGTPVLVSWVPVELEGAPTQMTVQVTCP